MRHFAKLLKIQLMILLTAVSCEKGTDDDYYEDLSLGDELSHEMIVLGEQLENPYSVQNMTKAVASLYPTKASSTIDATDMYVRFLPETDEQMTELLSLDIVLMDHPLDYQIIKDGDYYHDPLISEDMITWQYAVVPPDFESPEGIRCEILDECYIPSEETKSDDGLDWDAIEREAFRITGNESLLAEETKSKEKMYPKGRITIVDPDQNSGKPFGVAGVAVLCNSFVKFCKDYTDRDGYYEMGKRYSSKVRYRLMFKNEEGFAIGFNKILIPASTSALGKTTPEGLDYTVTSDSDRKLFCRSVVNNAAYDYIQRCKEDDLDITAPPSKLRLWIFQKMSSSSAPMLRHGTVLDQGIFKSFLGEYASLIAVFLPDITLGVKDMDCYADIYSVTIHELAHTSHYAVVGNDYWDTYIYYIVNSFFKNGGADYGTGEGKGAGNCEVGESWAYFMQSLLYNDRYGGEMPSYGMNYWFHPQIFRYLNERGLTVSQLFEALQKDVTSADELKSKLLTLYPSQSSLIEQVFTRYAN